MQKARTVLIMAICCFALCCTAVSWAAISVVDDNGHTWKVSSVVCPSVGTGTDIYLFNATSGDGRFITRDEALDADPHIFLRPNGFIGLVWSRECANSSRMQIVCTTYQQETGICSHSIVMLTDPAEYTDHGEPRMEVSPAGLAHLVYIATTCIDGQVLTQSLNYSTIENGIVSMPTAVSERLEFPDTPELYMGASDGGYPLMLVYMATIQSTLFQPKSQQQTRRSFIALQKDGGDPEPWIHMSKHLLPINN
jgi:hypothetical protein